MVDSIKYNMIVISSLDGNLGKIYNRLIREYSPIERMQVALDVSNDCLRVTCKGEGTKKEIIYAELISDYLIQLDYQIVCFILIVPLGEVMEKELEKAVDVRCCRGLKVQNRTNNISTKTLS